MQDAGRGREDLVLGSVGTQAQDAELGTGDAVLLHERGEPGFPVGGVEVGAVRGHALVSLVGMS